MTKLRTLAVLAALFLLVALPAGAGGAPFKVKVEKIERSGPGYSVSVAYPQVSGLAVGKAFNASARQDAEKRVRSFVTEAQKVRKEMSADQASIPLSLDTDVEAKYLGPQLIVFEFTGYTFLGGAHGEPLYETLALDPVTGRRLEIQDMFRPKTAWVAVVSKSCIAQLTARARELDSTADWIRTGAGPAAKNFQVFWPEKDGLRFVFPNYSVAPYSSGAPEIVVSYKTLKGILNPRYFR